MPQLSDLVQKRKFIKKEYRPWDLSGSGTVDGKESNINQVSAVNEEKIDTLKKHIKNENTPIHTSPQSQDVLDNKMGNILDNKQVTNRLHKGNKQVTTNNIIGNNQITNKEQTSNILGNITDNSCLPFLIDSVKKLSGIQKNIFYYVINVCSGRGVLDTGNILSSDLAMVGNCTTGSAKTSLIRLIEKQLIIRLQGKRSRGGHMVLGITKEIQAAAIQAQQALFNPFKTPTIGNNIDNNLSNISLYSSSNKNNITTMPEEWKKINFEVLQHIGFTEIQLRQLYDSNMSAPEIVQDSINRFAYSLTHSDKVKGYTEPLNVLMGILRKGQRWVEPNYISPKELALREMLEEKHKQKEQYDAMIKEMMEIEFPEWRKKLTEEEIKNIVPSEVLKMKILAPVQAALRTYFLENILLPKINSL